LVGAVLAPCQNGYFDTKRLVLATMSFDFSVNDDENMTFGRISKPKSSLTMVSWSISFLN